MHISCSSSGLNEAAAPKKKLFLLGFIQLVPLKKARDMHSASMTEKHVFLRDSAQQDRLGFCWTFTDESK